MQHIGRVNHPLHKGPIVSIKARLAVQKAALIVKNALQMAVFHRFHSAFKQRKALRLTHQLRALAFLYLFAYRFVHPLFLLN
jgi:hypothetical protein